MNNSIPNATSSLQDSTHMRAMVRALRSEYFTITEDIQAGTVSVTHVATKTPVLNAIQKGGAGSSWIVRHVKDLFV